MAKYDLTAPDGSVFEVEAPDQESAVIALAKHRQQAANQKLIEEANKAPEWAKPFMAARDVGTVGADFLTGGYGAKALGHMFGGEPSMDVAARRNRMGWAAPALEAGVAAGALPTAVPKVMGWMAGGPAARRIVGTGTAAVEGGLVGGIQAGGHDQDVASGVGIGAAGGAIGQQLGGILNKGAKWWQGVDDSVPQGIRSNISVIPKGKKASVADKVTVAENVAQSRSAAGQGDYQELIRSEMEKLLRTDKKSFTPEQRSLMERIAFEDPSTRAARALGDFLGNKFVTAGAGAIGGGTGGVLAGLLTAGGMQAGAKALKSTSVGGTREAMDDLLRLTRGRQKFQGPLSPEESARLTKAFRQLGISEYVNE